MNMKNYSFILNPSLKAVKLLKIYSVSCDLSVAPAPGQSAGPGTRLALTV
jgi:hypothetical protein